MQRSNDYTRTMKQYICYYFLFSILFLSACSEDDPEEMIDPSQKIVEVLEASGDFELLLEIIRSDGFETTLGNERTSFTLFAPTDGAVNAYLQANGFTGVLEIDPVQRSNILRYLTVPENIVPRSLLPDSDLVTLLGETLNIQFMNNRWSVNGVSFIPSRSKSAVNGTIYSLEGFLELPEPPIAEQPTTVKDWLQENEAYSWLARSLDRTELLTALGDTSQRFTLFAFNDAQINRFYVRRGWELSNIPAYMFKNFSRYHVLSGNALSIEDIRNAKTISTELKQAITVLVEGNATFLESSYSRTSVRLNVTPIEVANGFIYTLEDPLDTPFSLQNLLEDEPEFDWIKKNIEGTQLWEKLNVLDESFTFFAANRASLDKFLLENGKGDFSSFITTQEASDLASYHIGKGRLIFTNERRWDFLPTFQKVSADSLPLNLFATEVGEVNGVEQPKTGKYLNYYLANAKIKESDILQSITVTDLLSLHPQTDSLYKAVLTTSFENSLLNSNYTFLAPTNGAFKTSFGNATNGLDSLSQVNTNTLFYHIVEGYRNKESFTTGEVLNTFRVGGQLTVSTTEGLVFFGGSSSARVIANPFIATNGAVYLVDNVLLP